MRGRKLVIKAVTTVAGERLQTQTVVPPVSVLVSSPSSTCAVKNLSIINALRWKRVHIFGTWVVAFVLALKTSPPEFVQLLFFAVEVQRSSEHGADICNPFVGAKPRESV